MRRLRDSIADFWYKEPAYLDWISRLSGLWLIGIMPLELFVIFKFGPYHVPAWRIGHQFIAFPEPAAWISVLIWVLDCSACLAMLAGVRNRFLPLFILLVWLYYQTMDRYIFHSSFVILLAYYLLALAINDSPRSLSRRLIQIALSACYLFSAMHKFHPEFLSGLTLFDMLGRGFLLRPELLPAVQWLSLPRWFTGLLTYLVIALEAFIGIGLWFRASRLWAVVAGIFMHCAFTFVIPGIELFAPIAWTGYLAFFEKRGAAEKKSLGFRKPLSSLALFLIASFLAFLMPARFFFLPRFEYLYMSLYDRVPWGFSMFLFHEEVRGVEISYQTEDDSWHEVEPEGRMLQSSSDSDLIAMANYVAARHPEALRIIIRCKLRVNSHGLRVKECLCVPAEDRYFLHRSIVDGMQLRR